MTAARRSRWWLWLPLGLVLLLVTLAVFTLSTRSGARAALAVAAPWLPEALHIGEVYGSMLGPLRLSDVRWQDASITVHIQRLSADWRPARLLQGEVVLQELLAQDVTVRMAPAEEPPPEDPVSLPPSIPAPLPVEWQQVVVENLRVEGIGAPLPVERLLLRGNWRGTSLTVAELTVSASPVDAQLSANAELSGDYPLDVSVAADLRLPELQPFSASLTARGDLQRLATTLEAQPPYRLSMEGSVSELLAGPIADVSLRWDIERLPGLAAPVGTTGSGSLRGGLNRFRAQAAFDAQHAGVSMPVELIASGSAADVDLSLTARGLDPAVLLPGAAGNLDLDAELSVRQSEAGTVQAEVRRVSGGGELNGAPLQLRAAGAWNGDALLVSPSRLVWGSGEISVSGAIGTSSDLRWSLRAPDLAPLAAPFGIAVSGELAGEGQVQGTLDAPLLEAELRGERLAAGDIAVAGVNLQTTLGLTPDAPLRTNLSARNLRLAGQTIDSLALETTGSLAQHQLALDVRSGSDTQRLELEGALADLLPWRFRIGHLSLQRLTQSWQLAGPVEGVLDAQTLRLGDLCLRQLSPATAGRLCAQARLQPNDPAVDLQLTAFDLAALEPVLPAALRIAGRVDGDARWRGELATAALDFRVADLDLEVAGPDGWLRAARSDGGRVSLQPDAASDLRLTLVLPFVDGGELAGDVRLTPARNSQAIADWPLQGEVRVALPELDWLAALTDEITELAAALNGQVALGGRLGAPTVDGDLTLTAPRLRSASAGLLFTDNAVRVRGDHRTASLDGRVGSDGGVVSLRGDADWRDARAPTAALSVQGERFLISDSAEAHVRVSPDLSARYSARGLRLRGTVGLPVAEIQVAKVPRGAVTVSGDQRLLTTANDTAATPLPPLDVAVRLELGERVSFDGLGLTAGFAGAVDLRQQGDEAATASGEIRIIEGRYQAYGQDLEVREGKLLFAGGPVTEPGLDIRAERQATPDIAVGVNVQGPLRAPRLVLYSEPSLPQSEQLSYLVLGRPLTGAGGGEADALRQAALALGVKGGELFTGQVGQSLGVDTFGIQSAPGTGNEQAALVIGKYLTPKLYVSYGYGLFEPISTLRLEYQLSRLWRLVTESSNEATGGDLEWVRER